MKFRIENFPGLLLAGHHTVSSFAQDDTPALWRGFMPLRNSIAARIGTDLYNVQLYPCLPNSDAFDADTLFTRWAAVAVSRGGNLPESMSVLEMPAGIYAVFLHRGGPATAAQSFAFIYGQWLPSSGYILDDRPHFEVLGARYNNSHPDSEEEIWVPVRRRG
ncbi:GyrI-like domain-containing protein [Cnuella takakiae]|nr:GyrI-like domain-containing protein [Cnuella takakiae]OLY91185.1 hypothetical protein BUE76_04185 [Cnuella takakiae]